MSSELREAITITDHLNNLQMSPEMHAALNLVIDAARAHADRAYLITPSDIVGRFASLSSGTVRSIIATGQSLIDDRMADGVFE